MGRLRSSALIAASELRKKRRNESKAGLNPAASIIDSRALTLFENQNQGVKKKPS
jgi:hypothetical protein